MIVADIADQIPDWLEVTVWGALAVVAVISAIYAVGKVRHSVTAWARTNVAEVVDDKVKPLRAEVSQLSNDLVHHMGAEERLRQQDADDRAMRQQEHVDFREEMRERMDSIENAIGGRRRRRPRRTP